MKKKSKIKIIKDQANENNYTFLEDSKINSWSIQSQRENSNNLNQGKSKQKPTNTKNIKNISLRQSTIKALKFTKPSQRNHSSVYE
jgi:hypothetical protein